MPFIIADFEKDMKAVREIIENDYGNRFRVELENHGKDARPVLSPRNAPRIGDQAALSIASVQRRIQ
jgi:hypothetical protein